MSETKLFPQGIALGEAFCDREELRGKLQKSFLNNEHTVTGCVAFCGRSVKNRLLL